MTKRRRKIFQGSNWRRDWKIIWQKKGNAIPRKSMRFAFEEVFAQVSLLALKDISIHRLPRPTCNLETVD